MTAHDFPKADYWVSTFRNKRWQKPVKMRLTIYEAMALAKRSPKPLDIRRAA